LLDLPVELVDTGAETPIDGVDFATETAPLSFEAAKNFDRRMLRENFSALRQSRIDFAGQR
jgi:hypothetical protein